MTAHSTPVPASVKTKKLVDFYEALRLVRNGKCMTRSEWKTQSEYICLHAGLLKLQKSGETTLVNLIVSDGDIDAADWYEVTPWIRSD